jgi:hypothetical protein
LQDQVDAKQQVGLICNFHQGKNTTGVYQTIAKSTMLSSITTIARRSTLAASQKATVPLLNSLANRSFSGPRKASSERVPDEDYYDGHLMTDHLEYLDDMLDNALKMETSMEDLKGTYAKKRHAFENVGWMNRAEIDLLFDEAAMHKEKISNQISDLKRLVREARQTLAVDSPEGIPDGEVKDNIAEVNRLIQAAANHEDTAEILAAQRIVAVDGPDGNPDGSTGEDLREIDRLIDHAATHEDARSIEVGHQMGADQSAFAVDAPDGLPDGSTREDLYVTEQFVADAAKMEDANTIKLQHKMEDAVRNDRARDAEHDW